MIPTTQTLAAVALPVVMSPGLMMAPAPMKPTPMTIPLQDIRVTRRIGSEDGDRGLHEAAAGHRNQWECTMTGAAFRCGRDSTRSARRGRTPPAGEQGDLSCRPSCRAHWTLDVPKGRKHTGVEVVEQMAVEGP